jgi:hypothetical protein
LITPVFKAGHLRIVNKKKVLNELFHEEEHMNEIIIGVKRKVESLYNWVKQYFFTFSKLFYEDKKQYDYIMSYASLLLTLYRTMGSYDPIRDV